MKKILVAALEYGFILVAAVLIIAFVGLPPANLSHVQQASKSPIPRWEQGTEAWDKDLKLPTQSDRIVRYTMDVRLDTKKNTIS